MHGGGVDEKTLFRTDCWRKAQEKTALAPRFFLFEATGGIPFSASDPTQRPRLFCAGALRGKGQRCLERPRDFFAKMPSQPNRPSNLRSPVRSVPDPGFFAKLFFQTSVETYLIRFTIIFIGRFFPSRDTKNTDELLTKTLTLKLCNEIPLRTALQLLLL